MTSMISTNLNSTLQSRLAKGNGVVIENFLKSEKYFEILEFALNNEAVFRESQTITQEADYRKSSLIFSYEFPHIYEWMKSAILHHFPRVCHQLSHAYFPITEIEMQMTVHNDGNFYKLHNDSGSDNTCTRELTYVYYFFQEPQQFSGGELQ
ncbi:MAG: 2OG-Fe(II) oxygenase, partial [Limnothrix sp.]